MCELAGRTLDFVEIDALTSYYDAKNVGFDCVDQTRCQYVVFADADCLPYADWLEQLLVPFDQADAPVAVAGRTSYTTSSTTSTCACRSIICRARISNWWPDNWCLAKIFMKATAPCCAMSATRHRNHQLVEVPRNAPTYPAPEKRSPVVIAERV